MADILSTSFSVTLTEEEAQKTHRFLDETVSHTPISHEKGGATLSGGLTDHQIAAGVNSILIVTEDGAPITIKVGNTTATPFTNMKSFMYDGDMTDIFVSNPGVDPIKIKYVTGKF